MRTTTGSRGWARRGRTLAGTPPGLCRNRQTSCPGGRTLVAGGVPPPEFVERNCVGMSSPAGWYRDPEHADALRWWDGSGWTDHRMPLPRRPPGDSRPGKPRSRRRWVLSGAALAVLPFIGACSSGTGDPGPVASRSDTTGTSHAHPTASPEPGPPPTPGPGSPAPAADQPEPSTTPQPTRPPHTSRPGPGTALAVLARLPVKGRAAQTGYDRDEFGQAW